MGDVIDWPKEGPLANEQERLLKHAMGVELETCVVLAYDTDGNECIWWTSGVRGDMVWLAERFKHKLMQEKDREDALKNGEATAHYGGRCAQPEVCQKDGDSSGGSEGVQCGGRRESETE